MAHSIAREHRHHRKIDHHALISYAARMMRYMLILAGSVLAICSLAMTVRFCTALGAEWPLAVVVGVGFEMAKCLFAASVPALFRQHRIAAIGVMGLALTLAGVSVAADVAWASQIENAREAEVADKQRLYNALLAAGYGGECTRRIGCIR